jgi:hypothetical protein
MAQNTKRNHLLFLVIALLALVLLAASLSNLELQTGEPFPGAGTAGNDSQVVVDPPSANSAFPPFLKGILALIFLILMIDVPARLIALVNLKRAFQLLLVVITLLLIANLIPDVLGGNPAHVPSESLATARPSSEYPVSPLGQPPQGLLWLVSISFLLGVGLLAIKLSGKRQASTGIEAQLSQEAELALNAIRRGENLSNVVVRCYLQMVHALQQEQGIERDDNMTVREFEERIGSMGFPPVPVRQLSRLYEKVRYGWQTTTEEDGKTATNSLNEIILFCRGERG